MKDVHRDRHALGELARETGVAVRSDPAGLDAASRDFGGMILGESVGIVQPRDADEVQKILHFVKERGLRCAIRGRGYSQSGQSLARRGITLETCRLDTMGIVDEEKRRLHVGAGATLRQVITKTLFHRLVPPVLPLNLDMTVGGLLSAGGIGVSSHRFGPAINSIESLEVVSGEGERYLCGAQREPELFEAALSGLGRCAVITGATLALRRAVPRVATASLLYDNIQAWFQDYQKLAADKAVNYLEGFCWAGAKGMRATSAGSRPFAHWLYGIQVGMEHNGSAAPETLGAALAGLSCRRELQREDLSLESFHLRYGPRFQSMVESGAWQQCHPWLEAFLPLHAVVELLPEILDRLPLELGDGHRAILVSRKGAPQFFAMPEGDASLLFAVLPTGVTQTQSHIFARLREIHRMLLEAGAKRYLSGWLGAMNDEDWARHYGDAYQRWSQLKKRYDPRGVFDSVLFSPAELSN